MCPALESIIKWEALYEHMCMKWLSYIYKVSQFCPACAAAASCPRMQLPWTPLPKPPFISHLSCSFTNLLLYCHWTNGGQSYTIHVNQPIHSFLVGSLKPLPPRNHWTGWFVPAIIHERLEKNYTVGCGWGGPVHTHPQSQFTWGQGHFTHEIESPWPLNFKHSHWWKRRS